MAAQDREPGRDDKALPKPDSWTAKRSDARPVRDGKEGSVIRDHMKAHVSSQHYKKLLQQ